LLDSNTSDLEPRPFIASDLPVSRALRRCHAINPTLPCLPKTKVVITRRSLQFAALPAPLLSGWNFKSLLLGGATTFATTALYQRHPGVIIKPIYELLRSTDSRNEPFDFHLCVYSHVPRQTPHRKALRPLVASRTKPSTSGRASTQAQRWSP
jgi:hypothetical protein